MTPPATAGPIIRPRLNEAELRATALVSVLAATISLTNACRAGASNAAAVPKAKAITYTCHAGPTPVIARTPRTAAVVDMATCVTIIDGRFEIAIGEDTGDRGEQQDRAGTATRSSARGRLHCR